MRKTQKTQKVQVIHSNSIPDIEIEDNEIELKKSSTVQPPVPPVLSALAVTTPVPPAQTAPLPQENVVIKKKKILTEEHTQKIKDNLAKGREKRQLVAQEKQQQLEFLRAELEEQRQAKLLMEADKIKKKHAREMKKIEIVEEEVPKPAKTVQNPRKSKSIYQNQQSAPEIFQQPYQSPAFDIKFW